MASLVPGTAKIVNIGKFQTDLLQMVLLDQNSGKVARINSSMGAKLAIVFFMLMLAMAGAGSWYYKQTQPHCSFTRK